MTGRVTAISGYLTALFSGSPNRSSTVVPAAVGGSGGDSQDMASSPSRVQQHPPPQAGPSASAAASAIRANTSAVDKTASQNDTFMYGEELDSPVKNDAPHSSNKQATVGRSSGIASSGFYGSTSNSKDKGKGREVDSLSKQAIPPRARDKNAFRPVRLYRCPPVDRPLYTVDNAKHIITIYATDADSSYWPSKAQQKKTTETTSSATVQKKQNTTKDWHEPVTKGSKIETAWKAKVGQGLATILNLDGDPKAWKLAELPKGYGMFIKHHYQDENNHTFFHYIIGSTFLGTRRFQTSKEYTKHIAWLCQFGKNIRLRCQCKFCVKEFEKEGKSRTPIIQRMTENMPPAAKGATLSATAAAAPRKALQPPAKRARKASLMPGGDAPHQSSAPATSSTRQVEVVIPKTSSPALGAIRSNESSINSASATPAALLRPAVVSKKRARKGGVPAAVGQEPVIAIDDSENEQTHGDVLDEEAGRVGEASVEMRGIISSETITAKQQREKRQIPKVNYYVPSIDEFAKIDVAQDSSTSGSGNGVNGTGNGRPARSTRYNKSMRESLPPAPRKEPLPMYNGPFIHRKRHDDLKIHHAPYREHEIVWYRLRSPFTHSADPELHIAYWPGQVLHKTPKIETHHVEIVEMEDMKGNKMRVPQPVNAQYYTYTIDLFGIESVSKVECRVEEILPFAAYAVPLALNSGKAALLLRKQERALETLDPEKEKFRDALTTWAWARHWAIAIRTHFSPFGMFFDPETIKKMGRRRRRYLAAYNNNNNSSNGITVNGNGNKRSGIIINGKRRKTRAVKEAREKEMEREKQLIRISRQSYQGIWFGCEKFWVGDLVRLAGTYEYESNAFSKNNRSITSTDTAHLHLYRGVTRAGGEPTAQVSILEGLKLDKETEGKPAFFQITHIYREPIPAGSGEEGGEQGELFFDGYFYQAVKDTEQQEDDGDKWTATKSSTSFGGLQGTSDSSDTCSSDQDYIVDPVTGLKKLDLSVGHMYRRMLLPPPPARYSFQPLKSLDGKFEEDLTATIEPWMIAGRYYHSGVLFPDQNDRMTTKLARACNGKTFRPETQAQPTHWLVNRQVMIRASSRKATRDMQIFFSNREKQEEIDRKAKERNLKSGILEKGEEQEDGSDDDDGPLVTANRSSQNTPASGRTTTKKGSKKTQGRSKETRVSSNSAE